MHSQKKYLFHTLFHDMIIKASSPSSGNTYKTSLERQFLLKFFFSAERLSSAPMNDERVKSNILDERDLFTFVEEINRRASPEAFDIQSARTVTLSPKTSRNSAHTSSLLHKKLQIRISYDFASFFCIFLSIHHILEKERDCCCN